ncbi:MAG: amidohydrolase family protein [Anaerolineales bacterium]|nr:amidohydrolase family protein [Anaerolineales bacterium]
MPARVDTLLTNAIVLTMDDQLTRYEPGAVAVQGGEILAVGADADLRSACAAIEVVDCQGKVVMPGLVNAHTHVPMTLLRGLADDLRLDVWLQGYMMPVEREYVSPDFVHLGTLLACVEMIRSGVTCFADMYYFEEDVAKATQEVGMRAVCSQTVMKYPTPDAASYEESLALAEEFIQRWKDNPLIVPSVAPHAPYTCTAEILKATSALAVKYDVLLHTHLAETAAEVENSRDEHGMPVIPYVKKQNIFDAKVLAAHCVHIDEGEIYTLQHHKAGVAHNPSSNLKLASGFAPVTKMLEAGLHVGIGTDGPASNNDLDMFEEIRLAAFIAKAVSGNPTALPAQIALSMGTLQGARALHIDHLIGSLEPGKKADLILVDITSLHNQPRFKHDANGVYAQLVYSAKSSDVSDVMVNGRWLMRDRALITIAEDGLLAQAGEYARRIDAFLIQREQSVLSKLVAIGGAQEVESFEVQAKAKIADPAPILEALQKAEIEILHSRHYHEYDTYFSFEDVSQGYIRYREDEFIDKDGGVSNVRYRLTLIGQARENRFPSDVLLSRSRFIAPASHSLRFYREYFKPARETFIEKDRLRWRVLYQGIEFYINLDRVDQPDLGYFVEVKSRTWSLRDAENKATLATELLAFLGVPLQKTVAQDYVEIAEDQPPGG